MLQTRVRILGSELGELRRINNSYLFSSSSSKSSDFTDVSDLKRYIRDDFADMYVKIYVTYSSLLYTRKQSPKNLQLRNLFYLTLSMKTLTLDYVT